MPSLPDSIFLFVLALLLFGPKKLPMLARELGKWVGEFRRASNDFKMQMEEELRVSEREEREKKIAAMEAAAPARPALEPIPEPEHPHMPAPVLDTAPSESIATLEPETVPEIAPATAPETLAPLPIATSGDVSIMPPSTGLPTPRGTSANPLGGLLNNIPTSEEPAAPASPTENPHG